MAYEKTVWTDGATALSAENMNHIEDGIEALDTGKVDKVVGKGLSANDYTTAEKTKLAGIETGAEVNQNAFAFVDIESGSATSLEATSKRDTVTFIAGSNVTMTASPGNNIVTINAADTTYSNATPSAAGLMSAADKQKINSISIFSLTATGATTTIPAGDTATINFNCSSTDCELAAIQSISLADGVAICGIAKKTSSGSLVGWTVKVVNTTDSTVQVASPKITAVIIEEEIS